MTRAAIVLVALIGVALLSVPLPEPAELPPVGTDILDRNGRLLYQVLDPIRGAARPLPLESIAPALREATIAVEDATFANNPGVDLIASARALTQDIQAGRVVAGGSTITQQLARLRYLPPPQRATQSVARKLEESWLAVRMTTRFSKHDILEQYLNSVPYGNLAIGAEAAAWTYFGKPAHEVSVSEAALLAGLPQSPTDYDPFVHLAAAKARQQVVLDLMVRHGNLLPAQAEAARREPLQLNTRPFPLDAAHFVDYVRSQAPGTTTVKTTLDRDVQALAERAARRQVALLADHDVTDAAVVVLDPRSGDVLAMVGGVDYFDTQNSAQVNMAVARRQPGSAFKPITYAAALESGRFSEASIVVDERTAFKTRLGETYVPENYDRQSHGRVPLRVALASSLNVPAVRVLSDLGIEPVVGLANTLGLSLGEASSYDLSLTLGGGDVRLLDLVAAFGAFATGGVFHAPRVLATNEPFAQRAMTPETAWLITDMLSDDAARGAGFGRGSVLAVAERQVAVKTGTTSDFRDNWTIGYTPQVVVGVWVGNADNHAMRDVSGISGAAPLWREVLDGVLQGAAVVPFDRPAGLVQRELCADRAADADAQCAAHRLEWLPAGAYLENEPLPSQRVRIAYPDPGATFALDARLPLAAQRLPIEIVAPGPVDIYVDERPVAHVDGSATLGWTPTVGRHTIRAFDSDRQPQIVEIQVVPSGQ